MDNGQLTTEEQAVEEIDTHYTSEIVCPYCGNKHESDGDFHSGHNEFECGACNREFCFEPEYDVSFCSWKMEEELEREIAADEGRVAFYVGNGDEKSADVYRTYADRKRARLADLTAVAPVTEVLPGDD